MTIRETYLDKKLILEFIEHRREIKAPFTQKGLNLFITSLETLAKVHDAKTLIDTAIVSNWKTVYAPKGASRGVGGISATKLHTDYVPDDESEVF